MSDAGRGRRDRAGAEGATGDASRGSIGGYLARQRRLRGISIDELCEQTKIPRRNLERLEAGAFDANPDGFARGFVRTVAAALGLDSDEAVMRLMHEPDGDEDLRGGFSLSAWLLRLVPVALFLGLILAAWGVGVFVLGEEEPEPAVPGRALLLRPDAVRRLVEELPPESPPSEGSPPAPAPR